MVDTAYRKQYEIRHRHQAQDMKNKRHVSRIQKIVRSMPSPDAETIFDYCPDCNMYKHLVFRKQLFGNIEVSASCCGRVLGYMNFPQYVRKRKDRKVYLAWLNS